MRIYSPLIAHIKVTKKATTTINDNMIKRPKIILMPTVTLKTITMMDTKM